MTRKRRWWAGAAAAVVALGIIAIILSHRGSPPATDATIEPSVPLATVRTGEFVERVVAQGRIGPPAGSSAKIAFQQPGIISSIDVRVGETVRSGEVLAELDRAALGAALRAAQADVQATGPHGGGADASAVAQSAVARLAVAKEKLATLEAGGPAALNTRIAAQSAARQAALKTEADRAALEREQELLSAGVVAGKDVEAARLQLAGDEADQRAADARVAAAGTDFQAALKQAQADVAGARSDVQAALGQTALAQARLASAQIAFDNGVLTAPADGVVLAVLKHAGEAVDTTVPVIELGPAVGRDVTLSVPGDTARRIDVGDRVTLHVTSARNVVTQGTVTAVVPAVDPSTQTGTVVVNGAPSEAVPGDAVSASIVVGRLHGIVVPSSAIVQDPQTGNTVVFVHVEHPKPGASPFALRRVVVRAADAQSTALASGVKPGEQIAVQGGYMLLAPAGG